VPVAAPVTVNRDAVRTDQLRSMVNHAFAGADVWTLLKTRAEITGDRLFLQWHPYEGEPVAWTYRELAREAAAVAAGLLRRGVRSGDRVLIHLGNCPEFVMAWFGCAAIGAVAVTTNTRATEQELAYFAEDSGAVGVITQPDLAELVARSTSAAKWQVVVEGEPLSGLTPRRGERFRDLLADPDDLPGRSPDALAPMSVQYTSGTTSRPKGVVWSHANALWGARVNASHEDLRASDCHFTYLPLFHTNALAYSMLASLWVGARFVLVPKWSSSRFWKLSLKYRCTWLSLIGLSYRALLEADVPSQHTYRLFGAGLCDTPLDVRCGVKTVGWWGMTETVSHGVVGSAHLPDLPFSMGRPAPEYGIAVVGDDARSPVEVGGTGQLLIKGTPGVSMFSEYLNHPQLTRESYDEFGWFKTGDLVTVESNGYLVFADRAKDMLKVGAENVATSEIEVAILQTAGVSEAAVVGRPDDKLDEVPVAFVVALPGRPVDSNRVIAACAARLSDFKVPRAVYRVSELPRSTLGKVNKVVLRRIAAGELDLVAAERQWTADALNDPSGESADRSGRG
jgi:crotonobetaine/carnitine-CoA ligase